MDSISFGIVCQLFHFHFVTLCFVQLKYLPAGEKKTLIIKKNALMLTNKFNTISEIDEFHRIFIKASVCIRIDALLILIASSDMHSICIAHDVKNFIWLMLTYTHKK